MNIRPTLFAIPVLFAGLIAAAACSSSTNSSGGGGGGSGGGGGGGGGTGGEACTELGDCCDSLPSSSQSECKTIATAGNEANCTTNLATAVTGGYCTTIGTSSGSGSSHPSSGTGSTGGSGTGSHSGSGTGGGGAGTCASPSTKLPAGFVPPTGVLPTGCTSAEVQALGTCQETQPTTDAAINACESNVYAADGNFNNCGNCIFGTQVAPGEPIPATFGYFIIGGVYATLGDDTSIYGVNFGVNFGGCVIGADPVGGLKCGQDIMAQEACEFAVCLPLCAVTQAASMTQAGFNDFSTCVAAADKGACATYVTAQDTDCKALVNDAGTGPYDKCANLYNLDEGFVDGGKPTTTTEANLIGLICGGSDAGF